MATPGSIFNVPGWRPSGFRLGQLGLAEDEVLMGYGSLKSQSGGAYAPAYSVRVDLSRLSLMMTSLSKCSKMPKYSKADRSRELLDRSEKLHNGGALDIDDRK